MEMLSMHDIQLSFECLIKVLENSCEKSSQLVNNGIISIKAFLQKAVLNN